MMNTKKIEGYSEMFSREAEAGVLGSMLLDPKKIPDVCDLLNKDDFFENKHRILFDYVNKAYLTYGEMSDPLLIRQMLTDDGVFDDAGGYQYLKLLLDTTPSADNAIYYAKQVKKKFHYRQIVAAVEEFQSLTKKINDPDELLNKITTGVLGLRIENTGGILFPTEKYTAKAIEDLTNKRGIVPTGISNVDNIIGGYERKNMIIIAGRPSMGKTSFAIATAVNAGLKEKRILFITLEMGWQHIIARMIGSIAKESVKHICLNPENTDIIKAASQVRNSNILIAQPKRVNVSTFEMIIRQVKSQYGDIDVVIIDYLQLIRTSKKHENRNQEIAEISARLKQLAIEHDVAMVIVSQLSRAVESREDHRPRMSDLRDSGCLESDADVVIMLYRPAYYDKAGKLPIDERYRAEAIIDKNRNGKTGVAQLMFFEEAATFANFATGYGMFAGKAK